MATVISRKVFSYEEAVRLLPAVRERTRQAMERIGALDATPAEGEEESAGERVRVAAEEILTSWAEDIAAWGIEVKGPWLVDFDSGAGYYCWRWPEESLEYFHGYGEGFSGRVRLQ
ncbi:MAG TPA: DUF2203 family protein [Thermoanaerobaculia bacterium]|jgi:hypothetical protein|nr:DUF2203 family protein [Thermoanaerobaculia bacterium]